MRNSLRPPSGLAVRIGCRTRKSRPGPPTGPLVPAVTFVSRRACAPSFAFARNSVGTLYASFARVGRKGQRSMRQSMRRHGRSDQPEFLARLRCGDTGAYRRLIRCFHASLVSVAASIIGSRAQAEDEVCGMPGSPLIPASTPSGPCKSDEPVVPHPVEPCAYPGGARGTADRASEPRQRRMGPARCPAPRLSAVVAACGVGFPRPRRMHRRGCLRAARHHHREPARAAASRASHPHDSRRAVGNTPPPAARPASLTRRRPHALPLGRWIDDAPRGIAVFLRECLWTGGTA